MKNIIEKYILSKWWVSILLLFLAAFIFVSSLGKTNQEFSKTIDYILIATAILTVISAIWQFIKGSNAVGITQIVVLMLTFFCVSFIVSFTMMFGSSTDIFACGLELPKDVELNYPIDLDTADRADEIILDADKMDDFIGAEFQLYSSFQPGLYEYDLWLKSKIDGTVYLKAFEITQNIQLSNSSLRDRSTLEVEATNDKVKKFDLKRHFTIYEGDFGQPYGARFEVWFIQSDGKREFKILEKNYVIEGWMR